MSDRTHFASYPRTQKKPDCFPSCVKSASPASDTLILALGNPLRGDDGAGIAVLKRLVGSCNLPQSTTCRQCSFGGLLDELLSDSYRRVIIIDAAEMGGSPGAWVRFQTPHTKVTSVDLETCGTLHYLNLAEVIALGEALDLLPPEIVIYGIQPQEAGWRPTLSKPVQIAVVEVSKSILEELSN